MLNIIKFSFDWFCPEWTASEPVAEQQAVWTAPLRLHIIESSTGDLFQSCGHAIILRYCHDHCPLIHSVVSFFFSSFSSPFTPSGFGGWWFQCVYVCVEIKGRHVCRYEPWDPLWTTNTLRDISNWITAGGEQLSLWAGWGICYDKQTKSQLSLDELGVTSSHTHTFRHRLLHLWHFPPCWFLLPWHLYPFTPPSPFPPYTFSLLLSPSIFHLAFTSPKHRSKERKKEKVQESREDIVWTCVCGKVEKSKIVRVRVPGAEMLR